MAYREHPLSRSEPTVKDLLQKTFPFYRGRKISLETCEKLSFSDINWDGGSCTSYVLINRDNGDAIPVSSANAPWTKFAADARATQDFPENAIVAAHIIFCGKDVGVRFMVHPSAFDSNDIARSLAIGEREYAYALEHGGEMEHEF